METKEEIKGEIKRDVSIGNLSSISTASSGHKSSLWIESAFELITGFDKNSRKMQEETCFLLNQKPGEDNLDDENVITVSQADINKIYDPQNLRNRNYEAIAQTFLIGANSEDLTKYYAFLYGAFAGGVALLPEDFIGILSKAENENVRRCMSQAWSDLLKNNALTRAVTRGIIQAFEDSPEVMEQDMDEMEITRGSGTHLTKLIANLQSCTFLAPRALADLNDIVLKYFNAVRDEFISYTKSLGLFRPDVSKRELKKIFEDLTEKNYKGQAKMLVDACVKQNKSYMKNVIKWGALTPTAALKMAVWDVFVIIREYMPIFLKAFYVKRKVACFSYDFNVRDQLPAPTDYKDYEDSFVCINANPHQPELYYIEQNQAKKIEVDGKKFKKFFRDVIGNNIYKRITLAEAEKLIKLSGGKLPFGGNRYFIAVVDKKRALMMLTEVEDRKIGKATRRLLQIDQELFKSLDKGHKTPEIEDIIEITDEIANKKITSLYLVIKVEDKKANKLIFAKLIPDSSQQIGVKLIEIVNVTELAKLHEVYEQRTKRYAEKLRLQQRNKIILQSSSSNKKLVFDSVSSQEMQSNEEQIEKLAKQGCANDFTYPAVEADNKILPVAVYSLIIYFTTHLTNGITMFNNYVADYFVKNEEYSNKLPPEILQELGLYLKDLLQTTLIKPFMKITSFLPRDYGAEMPKSKKEQMNYASIQANSTGMQFLLYKIFDAYLAGNLKYQNFLVGGMVKFTKSQYLTKNEQLTKDRRDTLEYKDELPIEAKKNIREEQVNPIDIKEKNLTSIANWYYHLLLSYRIKWPEVVGLVESINQLRDEFDKIKITKLNDIILAKGNYYLIVEGQRNPNSTQETIVMQLLRDEQGAAISWQEVTNSSVSAEIIQASIASLEQDQHFFQVAIAAMLEQGFPINKVVEDLQRLKIDIVALLLAPVKFLPQDSKGMYRNLIQHALLARNFEFFVLLQKENLVSLEVISSNTSEVLYRLDPQEWFYEYVTGNFKASKPSSANSPIKATGMFSNNNDESPPPEDKPNKSTKCAII